MTRQQFATPRQESDGSRDTTPPTREEYPGPRRSSDGTTVTPDTSEPERHISATPTVTPGAPSDGIPLPPNEPHPPRVDDPPISPDVPYLVDEDEGDEDDTTSDTNREEER